MKINLTVMLQAWTRSQQNASLRSGRSFGEVQIDWEGALGAACAELWEHRCWQSWWFDNESSMSWCSVPVVHGTVPEAPAHTVSHASSEANRKTCLALQPWEQLLTSCNQDLQKVQTTESVQSDKAVLRSSWKVESRGEDLALNQEGTWPGATAGYGGTPKQREWMPLRVGKKSMLTYLERGKVIAIHPEEEAGNPKISGYSRAFLFVRQHFAE